MPRLALADVKKSVLRRDGEVYLVPHLLRAGERTVALESLTELYEGWVGRERTGFPEDAAAEAVGDYRLARCLTQCLAEWYEWRSPAWPGPASPALAASLAARGITSASALRLALWDAVNADHGGYLASDTREAALDAFAADLGMPRLVLDLLLVLDTDAEAVLTRVTDAPPTPRALAARYNQRVVESVLANASKVEWAIAPDDASERGLGTLVKRACFLARQLGVEYEVTTEATPAPIALPRSSADMPARRVAEAGAEYGLDADGGTLVSDPRSLVLTLFGPQEVTGAPNAYGERLANLCRALLGYRRAAERGEAAFAGVRLLGTARVYLHGKPLRFTLDERLLRLLRDAEDGSLPTLTSADAAFDSSLEAILYRDFRALEREGEAHGWHIEREPEPLVRGEVILVPDFALTRGRRRVYLELAGYWRPGYRERKARKLAALRDRGDLALAAPTVARADFSALEGTIPTLWYDSSVSAHALLGLLDVAFDDWEERLARLDVARVRARVAAVGCIPPAEAYALLRCYTRDEVARMVSHLATPGGAIDVGTVAVRWVEGVGLCDPAWFAARLASLCAYVAAAPEQTIPLAAVRAWLAAEVPAPEEMTEAVAEALARDAGLAVRRDSLFAAEVTLPPSFAPDGMWAGAMAPEPTTSTQTPESRLPARSSAPATSGGHRAQPRQRVRRKDHSMLYTTESLFSSTEE